MQTADTLIHARWIIPVEPRGQVLEHHALAVRNGRVVAIISSETADSVWQAEDIVRLPNHALLPGLVDAHTHAAMTLLRGLADDLPLKAWLEDHIWPAEARWVSPEFVRDGTDLALVELVRGGVTTFQDMYFFPDVVARVASAAGLRASLGLVVMGFPTAWAGSPAEYLQKGLDVRDAHRHDPLLSFALAPHAPYSVDDATLREVRKLADEVQVPIHMHVHETAQELADSVAQYGVRPLARLDALGLLDHDFTAVHMTQLDATEIALCAARGVKVVHCPESNLKLASGLCPVAALRAAGVTVAIGTDGAASNNDLDMLGEVRTATLLAKQVAGDPTVLPAAEALEMATLGGARALGLAEHIGSLTPGKWADCIAIDLSRPATQPTYDPLSAIVYAAGRDAVSDVWVAGRRLLAERALLTLDEQAILSRAAAWRARILP
jgi:5-methylthioadenosine/S-adenosylhomocysteine deaminase